MSVFWFWFWWIMQFLEMRAVEMCSGSSSGGPCSSGSSLSSGRLCSFGDEGLEVCSGFGSGRPCSSGR